jgi:hypothetical protein
MEWPELQQTYMSLLADMGFRPEIDSENDVHFMYEGGNYYISSNCDESYFYLMYPGFWEPENRNEQLSGLMAANATNRQVKAAVVFLSKERQLATATIECLIRDPSDVRSFLLRALRLLQLAVSTFSDELKGLAANG